MIWLTWRQFRVQGAVVYGALVVVAFLLVITGSAARRSLVARPAAASSTCSRPSA